MKSAISSAPQPDRPGERSREISRTAIVLFFAAIAALFLAVNVRSYRGYFLSDDFDTLSYAKDGSLQPFLQWLVLPKFQPDNFRPVATMYYVVLSRVFGLTYPPYIAALHFLHFVNLVLIYLLMRKVGLTRFAAGAGVLFYSFQVATFEIYWRPMYVFDLLCATFCLLTLLLFVRGHWLLGLVTFWLAYKSKELAVMLPVGLAAFELLLGSRNWKRLIPYFAISLNFGLQGVLLNPNANNPYAMHFTLDALWSGLRFYSWSAFFSRFGGFAVLIAAAWLGERRGYFGLVLCAAMLIPMLFLPGRMVAAFWYVPMIGLSNLVGAIAMRGPRWAVALVLCIWMVVNVAAFRRRVRGIDVIATENRDYVAAIAKLHSQSPGIQAFGIRNGPAELRIEGIESIIHLIYSYTAGVYDASSQEFARASEKAPSAILLWRAGSRELETQLLDASTVNVADPLEASQLLSGFYDVDFTDWRWATKRFSVRLRPPGKAGRLGARLMLRFRIPEMIIQSLKMMTVSATVNGFALEPRRYTQAGDYVYSGDVPAASLNAPQAIVDLAVDKSITPSDRETRELSVVVSQVGLETKQDSAK